MEASPGVVSIFIAIEGPRNDASICRFAPKMNRLAIAWQTDSFVVPGATWRC